MNKLFIDTHDETVTIAILNEKISILTEKSNHEHSKIVVPFIDKILSDNKLELKNIDEIIVVNGPGSFTGVRIGVTIAKTIAYSLRIPVKTISSLELFGISDDKNFDIIAIPDSKGFYSAKYNNSFSAFEYRKKEEFEAYVKENNYVVSYNNKIDFLKVLNYVKDLKEVNPHEVNPIYIKEVI